MVYRPNRQPAIAQMIRCRECDETMDAIFSEEARHTCTPCGGEALRDSSHNKRELTRVKKQKERASWA